MPLSYAFWTLMLVALALGLAASWKPDLGKGWSGAAGDVLIFLLLALLGWQAFGPALK